MKRCELLFHQRSKNTLGCGKIGRASLHITEDVGMNKNYRLRQTRVCFYFSVSTPEWPTSFVAAFWVRTEHAVTGAVWEQETLLSYREIE